MNNENNIKPVKPGVLDLLEIAKTDVGDVRDSLPGGSPLWGVVELAHNALCMALAIADGEAERKKEAKSAADYSWLLTQRQLNRGMSSILSPEASRKLLDQLKDKWNAAGNVGRVDSEASRMAMTPDQFAAWKAFGDSQLDADNGDSVNFIDVTGKWKHMDFFERQAMVMARNKHGDGRLDAANGDAEAEGGE